jgi:cytochrome c
MSDRFNTIAGWVLFSLIVGWGLSSLSGHLFQADKPHRPHTMGYKIAGVVEGGGEEAGPDLGTLLAAADPAAGEKVFAKCMACHTINSGGATGIGPNIFGIIGKPVGKHAAGFAYSSDLADHGGSWDYATLDAWLKSPKGLVPGTKMAFPGLSAPEDRANVIAYLKANGGGPDYPAPAAPAAAEGETAAVDAAAAPGESDAAAAGATSGEEPAAAQNAAPAAGH